MKQYVNDRFPHMIHGGDYNPEQWLYDKSIWDKDMELMMAAYGSLKTSQSEAQFLRNLERVESVYADIVHGKGNWRRNKNGEIEVGLGIGNQPSASGGDMSSAADALIAKFSTKKKGNR